MPEPAKPDPASPKSARTDSAQLSPENVEKYSFQADVNEVLSIVVNSLYSNKEIFLRELISNASDALDKLSFNALTDHELKGSSEPEIEIVADREARTLTIRDSGSGMTKEELVSNLGTIARSGSRELTQSLTGDQKKDLSLIGQFGVGFYSAYLVADRVSVLSRAAGSKDAYRWQSDAKKEFVVLLGPSGSGKSTLLNLISGIDVPSGGQVQFDTANLTAMSERDRTLFRRKNIGFVFQFFNLLPTLTVLENLRLPLDLNGIAGKIAQSRAADMLAAVGLADRGRSFPDRLSGGEQQRVAIARALVHDPTLVLADEPTGNLDADTGGQVMGLLDALVRRRGKTMVVVTHSADVVDLADRLFLLREGTLKEVLKDDTTLRSAIARGVTGVMPS